MNKIAAILLMVLIPTVVVADPQITPLNKYQKAPFSGVLYNSEAVADIIAWKETLVQQHQLALDQLRDSLNAQCNLQVSNLQAEVDGCNNRYDEMIAIKNRHIIKLEELALARSNDYTAWWLAGGIVLGIVTTVGITYAVNN